MPSLARVLKNQNTAYETVAIHPYEKSGYNRAVAYQSFGFDDFITQDDFGEYTITRKFMSDRDDYKKVIEVFEEKEEGTPLFVFNVTMQNHGGYGERLHSFLSCNYAPDGYTFISGAIPCLRVSQGTIEGLRNHMEIDAESLAGKVQTAFYDKELKG